MFLIQVATVSSETDKPHSGVVREPPFRKQRSGHGVTLPQLPSFLGGTAEWRQTLNITWIYHPLGPCPVTVLSLRASLHEKAHTWAFCFIQASSNSMHPICHRLGWIHQSQKSPHAIRWTVKVLHQTLMPQWRVLCSFNTHRTPRLPKGHYFNQWKGSIENTTCFSDSWKAIWRIHFTGPVMNQPLLHWSQQRNGDMDQYVANEPRKLQSTLGALL